MSDDQERCMTMAAPLLGDFYDLWHHAFKQYSSYPPEFSAEHDSTTAANCIRSHAWTEVVRRFDGRKGFKLLRLARLNLLLVRDETVWRFKLVDGAGRHSNYQTEQQRNFDDQLPLPGLPDEAVRLTSGYQPDDLGQQIDRIIIARPIGRQIEWAAQVNMSGGTASWEDITPDRLPGMERVDFRRRSK
ncbi:MAG TPA: hypothetical protein VG889_04225 [Rhizomicrobium sp.]|nr:hypothetical protein [Rhizomicrobium sp.]